MSKFALGSEFKSLVQFLPNLNDAYRIKNVSELINGDNKVKLKNLLSSYLSYYNLPLSNANNKSELFFTIGKIKVFKFDVVVQIYESALLNSRGIVFFIHGYLDHFGLHKNLINFLTQHGFIVVGIDLPGHGLSTGEIAHIADFGQYAHSIELTVEIIRAKYLDLEIPYFISGYSAGAAIGTEYLLRNNHVQYFSKALWIAPLLRIPSWKFSELACSYLPFIKYVPRESKNTSHDSRFITFIRYNDPMQPKLVPLAWIKAMHHWAKRLPKYKPLTIPTCILQGTEDKTIDWRYNIPNFSQIYLKHQVHYVYNGYHNLCNESLGYRELAFDYMLNFYNNEC